MGGLDPILATYSTVVHKVGYTLNGVPTYSIAGHKHTPNLHYCKLVTSVSLHCMSVDCGRGEHAKPRKNMQTPHTVRVTCMHKPYFCFFTRPVSVAFGHKGNLNIISDAFVLDRFQVLKDSPKN